MKTWGQYQIIDLTQVDPLLIVLVCGNIILLSIIIFQRVRNRHLEKVMEFRNSLYKVIGHDLKSPYIAYFRVIHDMRYFIKQRKYENIESHLSYLEDSFFATQNILYNLLEWVKDTDKSFSQKKALLNIKEVLSESTSHLHSVAFQNKIKIITDLEDKLVHSTKKNYLGIVLRNILDNCIKYSKANTINIAAWKNDNQLILEIKDDGHGISDEKLEHMNSIFSGQTKNLTTGNEKLGNMLIGKYIRKLHGRIIVSSKPSETIFRIEIA